VIPTTPPYKVKLGDCWRLWYRVIPTIHRIGEIGDSWRLWRLGDEVNLVTNGDTGCLPLGAVGDNQYTIVNLARSHAQ